MRRATVERNTKETQIKVAVDLDGSGKTEIATPLPFFNHMLDAFGRHSLLDLTVAARGDIEVDGHHTVEDTGICLGQAVREALADRRGISRYGDATIPMDEALARVAVDFGGRAAFVYQADGLRGRKVGSFDAELAREFFSAFAHAALCNLHLEVQHGENAHHILEALFKAFARAVRAAVAVDPRDANVPSTKGTLTA
ncbi:MAG: imidazoleglycerol-phosphate dehydratase HisB [Deltaproteobacteria bacterium]|nr:imidazoleglycerol-phosphate dehydratase HisB [Deltaproteobacteria bacterium]